MRAEIDAVKAKLKGVEAALQRALGMAPVPATHPGAAELVGRRLGGGLPGFVGSAARICAVSHGLCLAEFEGTGERAWLGEDFVRAGLTAQEALEEEGVPSSSGEASPEPRAPGPARGARASLAVPDAFFSAPAAPWLGGAEVPSGAWTPGDALWGESRRTGVAAVTGDAAARDRTSAGGLFHGASDAVAELLLVSPAPVGGGYDGALTGALEAFCAPPPRSSGPWGAFQEELLSWHRESPPALAP